MLKIYMDESGIHDGAAVVAVAGYISRPKHWRAWTKDWNKGKKPIKVFHSTDCANFQGEFVGCDKPRRDAFVANLLPILPAHELAGILIGIDMNTFKQEIAEHPELKPMFGEPYTACFQWAISIIMEVASQHGSGEHLAFIHEANSYQADAKRAFTFVKDELNPRGIKMTIDFGAKEDHPPLQAADILAYEGAKFLRDPSTSKPLRAWVALDPDKSRLIVRRYGPGNMGTLIKTLNDYRQHLLSQGWDGKLVA